MSTPFGSDARPAHPDRLPTLTEVLELGRGEPELAPEVTSRPETQVFDWPGPLPALASPPPSAPAWPVATPWEDASAFASVQGPAPEPAPAAAPALDAEALVARVMAELAPRVELLFEARVREAVAPALARAADLLIREARPELSAVLRELVGEAVSRVLDPRSDP